MRRRNRDPARLLFRRLVNLVVRHELTAMRLGHHLRQGRRQRRLPVVHVPDRPHVHVRLVTLEFLFGHDCLLPYESFTKSQCLMMPSAMLGGTSVYLPNSIVKVARPWLMERTVVAYPNISDSGTSAVIALPEGPSSIPRICPRRRLRSPITSPEYSSGVTTSTFMIGSRRTGFARRKPSLKPMEPAILNAISLESTSWYEPSNSVTLTSTTG